MEGALAPGHELAQQALGLLALTLPRLSEPPMATRSLSSIRPGPRRASLARARFQRAIPVQVVVLPGVQLGGQGVQPVAQPVLGDQLIKWAKSIAGLVGVAGFDGNHGAEVEALEPEVQVGETGVPQARLMDRQGCRCASRSQKGALLADFQLAVAVGPLEVEVQVDEQLVDLLVIEAELLAQDKDAAGLWPSKMRAMRAARFSGRRTAG